MIDLTQLKLQKSYREFNYLESEYDYRQDIISKLDGEFMNSVTQVLDSDPELKEAYSSKQEFIRQLNELTKSIKEQTASLANDDEKPKKELTQEEKEDARLAKMKLLYRKIAKSAHPDRTMDEDKIQTYMDATIAYDDHDILNLYRYCDKLNIEYQLDEEDVRQLEDRITLLKTEVETLERSWVWQWFQAEDSAKDEVIVNFVKS
jgi:hypothetical protein